MLIRTAGRRFEFDTNEYGMMVRCPFLGELFYDPEALCGRRWIYQTWQDVKREWRATEDRRRQALAG